LWAFIESADTGGWVQARDIGFVDENLAKRWRNGKLVVIIIDDVLIRGRNRVFNQRGSVGTICPLIRETGAVWEITVATNTGRFKATGRTATVTKNSAEIFPLGFSPESVKRVGNQLINKPYGWGGKFQDRDCSMMLRDFFLPFGIWLPRGSYNQIHSGKSISLEGLGNEDKERLIREKGIPFLTLVYLKGHIMLYVGKRADKTLMFHSIWGVNVRNEDGVEFKQVIGKSIVSTLNPGSELPLSSDSIPTRICRMLNLSCEPTRFRLSKLSRDLTCGSPRR
jgi:NlpC/P60 family